MTNVEEVAMEVELVVGGKLVEDRGTRGRLGGVDQWRVLQDVQQVQTLAGGAVAVPGARVSRAEAKGGVRGKRT